MDTNYETLITSILTAEPSENRNSVKDFMPIRYRYKQELLSPAQPKQYLHLIGGGRVDASAPFSLSFHPCGGLFILSSLTGSGTFSLFSPEIHSQGTGRLPSFAAPSQASLPVNPGSILLFDCSSLRNLRSALLPWSFRLFYVEGAHLQTCFPLLNHYYATAVSVCPVMAFTVEKLASLPQDMDLPSLFSMHRLLTDLLSDACAASLPRSHRSEPMLPSYLQDLRRYIHDCTNLTFSLAEMEKRFGISRYRLCREYHAAFQVSPLKDFNQVRILEAKKLLLNTNLQVQEISSRLGYENINHFVQLFKAETGMTPGAFRSSRK